MDRADRGVAFVVVCGQSIRGFLPCLVSVMDDYLARAAMGRAALYLHFFESPAAQGI